MTAGMVWRISCVFDGGMKLVLVGEQGDRLMVSVRP